MVLDHLDLRPEPVDVVDQSYVPGTVDMGPELIVRINRRIVGGLERVHGGGGMPVGLMEPS